MSLKYLWRHVFQGACMYFLWVHALGGAKNAKIHQFQIKVKLVIVFTCLAWTLLHIAIVCRWR